MIHNKFRYLMTLVALFAMTAGAWADVKAPSVKPFTVPDTWNVNEAYTAADLPADFAACTDDEAAAWAAACTDEQAVLIYSLANCYVKAPKGSAKTTYVKTELYGAKNNGRKIYYTAAPAEAQEETLLTTITPTGDGTYSETTAGAVTVTPAGSFFYSGSSYGWRWDSYGSLTVTANEGYTITRCVFIQQGKNQSVTISEAPFELNFEEWVCLENTSMDGVTSIEVYGTTAAPAGPEVTWDAATKTGTFAMPGYDVELEVAYFNITAPTANTTDGDIHAGTATPLINAASTTEEGATIKYLVTATNEQPTSTDGFSADVPTAQATAITGPGTYYVWYYLDFESGDDSDISPTAIQVTVADYLNYTVSLAEGTADADKWAIAPADATDPEKGVKPGTEITLTYSGTKRVKSVKAVKEPEPKPAAEATAEDKGKVIGADGKIYADVAAATAAGTTAVAKIIYIGTTGHATYSHGLALALTDEASKMAWEAAIDACSAKNTSTPVTGATWLLASKDQWDYMLGTDGPDSYYDLRDGFNSVGGSNLQFNYYWSSTEYDSDRACCYYFAQFGWVNDPKGKSNYVRACLAF